MLLLFFKQKTAYELRISDWSSDVCSSDLQPRCSPEHVVHVVDDEPTTQHGVVESEFRCHVVEFLPDVALVGERQAGGLGGVRLGAHVEVRSEERRVGNECVRRVDLGGRRLINKNKQREKQNSNKKK